MGRGDIEMPPLQKKNFSFLSALGETHSTWNIYIVICYVTGGRPIQIYCANVRWSVLYMYKYIDLILYVFNMAFCDDFGLLLWKRNETDHRTARSSREGEREFINEVYFCIRIRNLFIRIYI